jgi:hypothetical protein
MSSIRKHSRLLAVAICCVGAGGAVSAIATAGASTSSPSHPQAHRATARIGALRRLARPVQGSLVVHTKTGFATVTFQRGKVDAVNGRQLTITEGTPKASYKTVTVTVPAGAVVRDDRKPATLADVKPGQRVLVFTGPHQTHVIARTPEGG